MRRFVEKARLTVEVFCAAAIFLAITQAPARAESVEHTNLSIVVKDAETGQPINQARLTLQFREPGKKLKPKLPHHLSYSAKTNPQGRYRFTNIPKGTVRIIVTADQHQALGKDFELERDNQVIEVLLKKPQPLL